MSQSGNIAILFPNGQRMFFHTHEGGDDLMLMLYDALAEAGGAPAELLAGQVAARLMEHGEPAISFARLDADADELHIDVAAGEVHRVVVDAEGVETCLACWSFAEFLTEVPMIAASPSVAYAASA